MAMSDRNASAITEFRNRLTPDDIAKLRNAINVPSGICQSNDPSKFLFQLSKWRGFKFSEFVQALSAVRPTLVESARSISWLSAVREPGPPESTPMCQLIQLLREQLSTADWRDILLSKNHCLQDGSDHRDTLSLCLKLNIITQDLTTLIQLLEAVERNSVALMVAPYKEMFKHMTKEQFQTELRNEARRDRSADVREWHLKICKFICEDLASIEPTLGDCSSVDLEKIFTPLNIIKFDPSNPKIEDRGNKRRKRKTENEDILEKLSSCDAAERRTWWLIGDAGSGKTWLCRRVALLAGKGRLHRFQFCLSIPCRSQEWHSLEEARAEKGQKLSGQCLQEWLALGMPLGAAWTEQLTQHIVKTEGEGLLLIIDSVDEFTKSVPVETTVLSRLLQRQTLAKSTLLVTSRPAAWSHVSARLSDTRVDAYYQVLGFSPADRDGYVSKRLSPDQLKEFQRMLALHEEIAVLSLVPVNASLFTSLFQLSDDMSARTLTELYSHLFLYLIRRQLCRMKLQQFSKAEQLCQLDAGVLQCVHAIGEVAYLGVSARQLSSTQKIPLRLEGEQTRDSECLGLVQVQMKELTPGARTEVWCFCHLTLQEFSAALFLLSVSWTDRCLMARFMVSSREVFSVYRMVLRFSCGLLCQNAASIVPIVFRHQLTPPVPYKDMPLKTQLNCVDVRDNLNKTSGWYEFSAEFASLSTLIGECHLTPLYSYLNRFLPDNLYFYFPESVALNDWNNFLSFLPGISKRIEVIYLYMNHFTPEQLSGLLEQLASSCVRYLALFFIDLEPSTLETICDTISNSPPLSTQLSIEIQSLPLTDSLMDVLTCSPLAVGNLSLYEVPLPDSVISTLSQSMSSLHCVDISFHAINTVCDYRLLVQEFSQVEGLQGMHLDFPVPNALTEELENFIISKFKQLTDLREISCRHLELAYSILSEIEDLSQLTYLNIYPYESYVLSHYPQNMSLSNLVYDNCSTLKVLELYGLHNIGFQSLNPLLDAVHKCTALLELSICSSVLELEPHDYEEGALESFPPSLVQLHMRDLELGDSGLFELCNRLAFHPALRSLEMKRCSLSPESCQSLVQLIPTLSQLVRLDVRSNDMNALKDTTEIDILSQFASFYKVELSFTKIIFSKQISNFFEHKIQSEIEGNLFSESNAQTWEI